MRTTLVIVAICLCLAPTLRADDVDLPAAAQRVFNEKYKDCVHKTMRVSKAKGQESNYTVEFEDAKGTKFEIEITDLGEVVAEQQEVKLPDLPKTVKDTIKDTYPSARLIDAWLSTRGGQTVYVVGVKARDNDIVVKVSQDGTTVLKSEKALPKKKS